MKSVDNEKAFLDDASALIKYKLNYASKVLTNQKEKEKFKMALYLYDLLLEETADFIKDIGYDTALDSSAILSYLIKERLLSADNKPMNINPEKELLSKQGTSIVLCEGCCRHYADLSNDVLTKLSLYSDKLFCYDKHNIFKSKNNSPANHVINLVIYKDTFYGLDTYNGNRLYKFISPVDLKAISTKFSNKLRYKPYHELIEYDHSPMFIEKRLKEFEESSKKETISPYEYEDIKYDSIRKVAMNTEKLNKFDSKTKVLRKEIRKELLDGFDRYK
jgi:hypothetical protein